MDDVHGFGPDPQVEKFKEDLAAHIWLRDGGAHREGAEYDHLNRFRKRLNGVMTIESNPKYLDAVLELLGLEGAKDVHTPSVPQCTDSVLEVCSTTRKTEQMQSILGSMLEKPTQRSMIALERVTRYLKGTRHFVNKLELDGDVDKHVARLEGFSDSDWAGSTDRKSQSSGALFVDGAPLFSFSRRQSLVATSSGTAEFYAGCATAEEMLLAREVLMFFGCQVEAPLHMDSAAARGICRREGVGKVKSLEVRTLWLQQVVKAKTLTLKTVKSQDNCADLGTKTLAVGTLILSLLRNLNGLVDKNAMDSVPFGVQAVTISPGESRMLRATALKVLGRDCKERSDHVRG